MLVVAVVAVAYGSAAPQLGVAEFSPAARNQVAPPPTTAGEPEARLASGGRGRTTTTQPSAATTSSPAAGDSTGTTPTTRVGRGRPCYGTPPRQLPDPRSPACAPTIFEGDNGGATSQGVSATEIRVGITPGTYSLEQGTQAVVAYLNRHFEFYGRHIVPVFVAAPPSGDAAGQRAYAEELAAQGLFALVARPLNSRWLVGTFHALARKGIVVIIDGFSAQPGDDDLDAYHPYLWSVGASLEQQQRQQAAFVCATLAGKPPSHAPELSQSAPRKFGVLSYGYLVPPHTRPLVDGLDSCDARPTTVVQVSVVNDSTAGLQTAFQRFKSDGVTTLICACIDNQATGMLSTLSASGWTPEIVAPLNLSAGIEEARISTNLKGVLRTRLFGLQPYSRVVPPQAQQWFAAALEGDAAVGFGAGYDLATEYDQWLVLASGIQAAGPALSAATFGQGLMSSPFPNSEVGQAPYYVPAVGFGPGDHSWFNDFALVWWSAGADAYTPATPTQVKGSWCYLDGGARFSTGQFPADAASRFYAPAEPCR